MQKRISRTDLLGQFYVLPHWDGSCRSNLLSHSVKIYWHQASQYQHQPCNTRILLDGFQITSPYCPGHAAVSGNEQADRLASTADIIYGLQLGRAEVLRGLRNFLNMDRPEHHCIDRLKERGVEKGSGQHSILQGWEWSVFNHTNIGTVWRATLGRLLRDGAENVWAFPSLTMPSWAETETELVFTSLLWAFQVAAPLFFFFV